MPQLRKVGSTLSNSIVILAVLLFAGSPATAADHADESKRFGSASAIRSDHLSTFGSLPEPWSDESLCAVVERPLFADIAVTAAQGEEGSASGSFNDVGPSWYEDPATLRLNGYGRIDTILWGSSLEDTILWGSGVWNTILWGSGVGGGIFCEESARLSGPMIIGWRPAGSTF